MFIKTFTILNILLKNNLKFFKSYNNLFYHLKLLYFYLFINLFNLLQYDIDLITLLSMLFKNIKADTN